jgi:hypothetical protein
VLAAGIGGMFKKVRAGTIIMPPPTPSIEPKVPAANPTAMSKPSVAMGSNKGIVSFEYLTLSDW